MRTCLYDPRVDTPKRPDDGAPPKPALTPYQRAFLGALLLLLLASVVMRVLGHAGRAEPSGAPTPYANAVVQGTGEETVEEPEGPQRFLPYLTGGSLFGLLGFALGWLSRKFLILVLISVALLALLVQALASTGLVDVDGQAVLSAPFRLLSNLSESEALGASSTVRAVSLTALLVGWMFGFRRG